MGDRVLLVVDCPGCGKIMPVYEMTWLSGGTPQVHLYDFAQIQARCPHCGIDVAIGETTDSVVDAADLW